MFPRDLITKTLLTAVCAAALAQAHSAGTTQAASGVPGEGDCTACHTLSQIGDGGVTVAFSDTTHTYSPGVSQHLKMTITDTGAQRWGFQLTARLQSNQQIQAGNFVPGTDSQLFCTNIGAVNYSLQTGTTPCPPQQPLIYVDQTFDGTHITKNSTPGSVTYEMDWIPPADPAAGTVILYIAALASNNDGNVAGDITYNARYIIPPAIAPNLPLITSITNSSGVQSTITAGAVIAVRGTGLATSSRSIAQTELINGQYPATADGVTVTIANVPAYITALDPSRIAVIVPKTTALGLVQVIVTNAGVSGIPYLADLEPVAPSFFLASGTYVMAFHQDGTAVAPAGALPGQTSSPAQPGETITLTVVGLGATNPRIDPGIVVPGRTVANLIQTPLVLFNTEGVLAQSATLIPGNAGVFAVTVQVPSDLPDGDTPIQIQVQGVQSDPGFFISVHH